jgi:hypothetical protein
MQIMNFLLKSNEILDVFENMGFQLTQTKLAWKHLGREL